MLDTDSALYFVFGDYRLDNPFEQEGVKWTILHYGTPPQQ
ncbi:hypothetical protein YWY31_17000 [Paenibacillus illinoisensis]